MCLKTSDIVWASGPHFPGLYNDLQIFCEALIHMITDGEHVKADKRRGYGVFGLTKIPLFFSPSICLIFFWVNNKIDSDKKRTTMILNK